RATLISGASLHATAIPITPPPTISLSYRFLNGTNRPLTTVTTNATGGFSYNWSSVPQLPNGRYLLVANSTGSVRYNAEGVFLPVAFVTPTTISPGVTVPLSYPYV